ncbi:hypothetical protein KEM48_009261 [Puccinia striiformis f. sp. tritici PST-130]|nr:hypothetical protein Pst134EB_020261 [Puccinia striiformis f. sp. tritici]KAI9623888.1 hypothetical protein KEM48_009261 [Puccinia striiformis f. sp. tritici PST-130]
MAKLSDLPDELVDSILEFTAIRLSEDPYSYFRHGEDHHELDHNGIIGINQRIRPHLENPDNFCYTWRLKDEDYPPTY